MNWLPFTCPQPVGFFPLNKTTKRSEGHLPHSNRPSDAHKHSARNRRSESTTVIGNSLLFLSVVHRQGRGKSFRDFRACQRFANHAKFTSEMNYQHIITIQPGKRGGRPCIRNMRIAVADVLGWLAAGMSHEQILSEYPELTEEDIRACLAYAADRERRLLTAAS